MMFNLLALVVGLIAPAAENAPAFKSVWKVDMPAECRRIAIADISGDKKLSFLVLGKTNTLTVHSLADKLSDKEMSVDLGDKADEFGIGTFQAGKPAMIVLPNAVYYKKGAAFEKKAFQGLDKVTGVVRFSDGVENVFYFPGNGEPESHAIDLGKDNPLTTGQAMPSPEQDGKAYKFAILHCDLNDIPMLPLPDGARKTNCIGFFSVDGSLFIFLPWLENNNATLALVPFEGLHDGNSLKPAWRSPKLAGKIVDVALGPDIKTGKGEGIYLLQATGEDGKGRVLEYWAPEK